jgi:hypothetical protein
MFDASHAEALHSRAVDRALPAGEFLKANFVTRARFVDPKKSAIYRRDNFSFPPNDPPFR